MQVRSIAECSNESILQYFRPSISYHLSVGSLFCLFLSGRLRQVLLYSIVLLAGLMQSLRPHVFPEEYSQMSDFAWKRYNVYFTDAMDDY